VTTVNLFIRTKNKNSLKKFIYFLSENVNKNFNSINFYYQKKKKKKIITLLKSPHVNKTAQEQFEMKYFSKKLKIITTQTFKFLIFLKNIKNFLFSDIQIKTKFTCNSKEQFLSRKKILNLDNLPFKYSIKQNKNLINKNFKDTKTFVKKIYTNKNKYLNSKNLLKLIDFAGH
jgi:ribosomal protein S10